MRKRRSEGHARGTGGSRDRNMAFNSEQTRWKTLGVACTVVEAQAKHLATTTNPPSHLPGSMHPACSQPVPELKPDRAGHFKDMGQSEDTQTLGTPGSATVPTVRRMGARRSEVRVNRIMR